MKFKKLDSNPDLIKMQDEMIKFWHDHQTFEKSVNKNRDKEVVFYDGPPFPTGKPHHGTVLVSFIKDMIARFWTMKGHSVPRVWGWDCHGLPIETQAEEVLGITDKKQIEAEFGIAKFNETCYNVVSKNNDTWRDYVINMCRWTDYDNAYRTMDTNYMESILWAFKECYKKDLIYQDYRVTPYCYRCETALSISDTRESDSTRPRQDPWAIGRFGTDEELNGKKVSLLAWTTTPWTLVSHMALAVNPDLDYAYVEVEDGVYISGVGALANFPKVFGEEPNIIKTVKGSELKGLTYEPLVDYFKYLKDDGAFRVVLADFVGAGDGTGIVHMAPGFGEDDYWTCKKEGIPLVCPVDEKGRYMSEITDFAGKNVIEANQDVIRLLKSTGKAIADGTLVHNYPHCWRCKVPLIYKAMDAWYFSIEKIKDRLLYHNQSINWVPEVVKDNRFGKWLENARDWNISRNRYWSTPIPVWECDSCDVRTVLGSIAEIKEKSGVTLDNLHRQYMDKITFACECGGTKTRIPEVLDCWFESGSVPFASVHYPFSNKEWFENNSPSDFVVEYTGQIRCWFYYLHVMAVALFDKPPFKTAVAHGTVLAGDGKKLSKSSKNYTDPMELMRTIGTDAFRLYLFRSNAIILNDMQFDETGLKDQVGQVLLPLYNCANFFNAYAILDGFEPKEVKKPSSDNELDKWILAKLYETEKGITANMTKYQIDKYIEPIVTLIEDFSNWYLRRSRRRFWASGQSKDKQDAYETTYYVLVNICKLLAPAAPILSEKLYQHLTGEESVHLAPWPDIPAKYQNERIIFETDVARRVITLARYLREKESIKIRQPLATLELAFADSEYNKVIDNFGDIIKEEINVKNINVLADIKAIAQVEYLANFKTLGPKYGKEIGKIAGLIKNGEFTATDEGYILDVDGKEEVIGLDDVITRYQAKDGMKVESDKNIIASLDTNLTEDLKTEGMAREIVRTIQDARKELDLEITDRIKISFDGEIESKWLDYITNETLSDLAEFKDPDFTSEVLSNDQTVIVNIKKQLK